MGRACCLCWCGLTSALIGSPLPRLIRVFELQAFLMRKLKIQGSMALAMKLQPILVRVCFPPCPAHRAAKQLRPPLASPLRAIQHCACIHSSTMHASMHGLVPQWTLCKRACNSGPGTPTCACLPVAAGSGGATDAWHSLWAAHPNCCRTLLHPRQSCEGFKMPGPAPFSS